MKYGHTKSGLKKNDISISFTALNSNSSSSVAQVTPHRNEETNRDQVSPEVHGHAYGSQ